MRSLRAVDFLPLAAQSIMLTGVLFFCRAAWVKVGTVLFLCGRALSGVGGDCCFLVSPWAKVRRGTKRLFSCVCRDFPPFAIVFLLCFRSLREIELGAPAWQAEILPLNHIRILRYKLDHLCAMYSHQKFLAGRKRKFRIKSFSSTTHS